MRTGKSTIGPTVGDQPCPSDASDAGLLERFVTCRDEAAFAALVTRHGPMVFGVCRRLLRHDQDAEDAFQATFLILVRKAAAIGRRELLGNWLYGVAARVAGRARLVATRRQLRETADMERIATATREPAKAMDMSAVIDEEVQRLPARYRGPVVLYYLQGRTNEEVAGELRCPIGTIKTRLSRARELLRKRLIRRGLALSPAVFSAALLADTSAASVPPTLIDSTLKAASGGSVSAQAAALTKGVLHTMFVSKMKTLGALVLALTMIGGLTSAFAYHVLAAEGERKPDNENILGEWKVDSVRNNGAEPAGEEGESIKNAIVEFTADKVTAKLNGGSKESSYKLDPTTKPKTIDIVHSVPGGEEQTVRGIYKLEGDTLTICSSKPNEAERPKEFESKEGSNTMLLVLKRVKK